MNEKKSPWQRFGQYALLFATIAIVRVVCNQKRITNGMSDVSDGIIKASKELFSDSTIRKKYTDCVLEKIKNKYPNGVQSVSNDTLERDFTIFSKDCAGELKGAKMSSWSNEIEVILKNDMLENPEVKKLKIQYRAPFCDCVIEESKKIYPDGMPVNPPEARQDSIAYVCAKRIGIK